MERRLTGEGLAAAGLHLTQQARSIQPHGWLGWCCRLPPWLH
jgi:hypothetical protein